MEERGDSKEQQAEIAADLMMSKDQADFTQKMGNYDLLGDNNTIWLTDDALRHFDASLKVKRYEISPDKLDYFYEQARKPMTDAEFVKFQKRLAKYELNVESNFVSSGRLHGFVDPGWADDMYNLLVGSELRPAKMGLPNDVGKTMYRELMDQDSAEAATELANSWKGMKTDKQKLVLMKKYGGDLFVA